MYALISARSSSRLLLQKTILPRAVVAAATVPNGAMAGHPKSFTIADKLSAKEKHEEDRYIREQEKKYFEKKKAELEKKMHDEDLAHFKEAIAPKMAEVSALLQKTGDKVSDEALEALARWKMGK